MTGNIYDPVVHVITDFPLHPQASSGSVQSGTWMDTYAAPASSARVMEDKSSGNRAVPARQSSSQHLKALGWGGMFFLV